MWWAPSWILRKWPTFSGSQWILEGVYRYNLDWQEHHCLIQRSSLLAPLDLPRSFLLHIHFVQALRANFTFTLFTMYYSSSVIALAAFIPAVYSHAVILEAVGDSGQSQGFLGKSYTASAARPATH